MAAPEGCASTAPGHDIRLKKNASNAAHECTDAWLAGCKGVAIIGFPSKNPLTKVIGKEKIAASFQAYFDEFC